MQEPGPAPAPGSPGPGLLPGASDMDQSIISPITMPLPRGRDGAGAAPAPAEGSGLTKGSRTGKGTSCCSCSHCTRPGFPCKEGAGTVTHAEGCCLESQ